MALATKAATFVHASGTLTLQVQDNICTNFKTDQPNYVALNIEKGFDCVLFDKKNCVGKGTGLEADNHNVEELKFRSVACFQAAA
ncbi:hypothetical protein LMH87_006892 [Akanthomyces muscarius]|uniref:Uncharacterized protein n=1 Tax=Akanthomyces muscarius TaxID=2231603 RepID=A0A9W8QP66_AKAMU|nr:hypothetical protein LMH87_006892 [Akanthomyces muscarius]KAJ4165254.1 hypothetical protein LMH87_006892 [Akanthomyces muscarius]